MVDLNSSLGLTIRWLATQGLSGDEADWLARGMLSLLVVILSLIANLVVKRLLLRTLRFFIVRTRTTWDDAILERRMPDRLAHLTPALVIYMLAPLPLEGLEGWVSVVQGAMLVYMILVGILAFDAFLNAVQDVYRTLEVSREIPVRGFVQVFKIGIYFLGIIFAFSILLGKSPVYLLSGLGALTAVLLLVFKDTILGFVAGIQLNANRMVAVGDWIEMPKYGADGDVVEVSLNTVKVQNWDKTITTIPTYALVSDSFKNWQGMQASGGRRIKRAVHLDVNTIKFCTEEMLARFAKIQYISDYIEQKKEEIGRYNAEKEVDVSSLVNGRRMTNVGSFRAYVTAYLRNHPMVNQEMTFLVRQLAPQGQGLPIEIYVFCKDKVWANYEAIQADIFDHILAVVPEFDLQVFQHPTGADFQALRTLGTRGEATISSPTPRNPGGSR